MRTLPSTPRPVTSPTSAPQMPLLSTPTPAPTTRPSPPKNYGAASAPSNGACPVKYSTNHGLENTGRKALVLYTFTSHRQLHSRQVEIDNFQFFRTHAMLPPDTPTALFSSVDYVITTSNMSRRTLAGVHGVVQCALNANVRVLEAPHAPCDLCGYGRGIKALGGAELVAKNYEYVFMVNSGVRGPFFTEAPSGPDDAPPVTWLDHFALGGEHVYTGAIMTSTVGMATSRPYLLSFAFGFPTTLLPAIHPVLFAGCLEMVPDIPDHWESYLNSFDADLHTIDDPKALIAKLKSIVDSPGILKHTPMGHRDTASRRVDDQIAAGAESHRAQAEQVYNDLIKGVRTPPLPRGKMRCVYRTEVQLLKTALETKLPPEIASGSNMKQADPNSKTKANPNPNSKTKVNANSSGVESSSPPSLPETAKSSLSSSSLSLLHRPRLTPQQRSLLSPVLSGYLHEGHFFGHSLGHSQTVLTMGHGLLLKGGVSVGICGSVMVKHGGVAWRKKQIARPDLSEVQILTLAQAPSSRVAPPGINIAQVLTCSNRTSVEPLR